MKKTQVDMQTHQSRIQSLRKSTQERSQSIKSLGDNRENNEAIERYARQKGYAKKGEIIQEIPQPEPVRPATKAK